VSWAGQVWSERRLCRVIERLERMVDTLNEALDCRVGRVSATVAAEVLAREADHCIRNRLQAVIALLERQALRAETDAVRDTLNLASARVEAVARVHATLHAASARCGIIPELDLGSYLGRLCAALGRSMGADRKALRVGVKPLTASPATRTAAVRRIRFEQTVG
jgi:two-component sensor histidine kinase